MGARETTLFWRLWETGESWGSVLLIHGLGEHSGRYAHVAERLTSQGISVFSFDLRGHGRSGGARGDLSSFREFLQDVVAVKEVWMRECPGALERFLLGHSLGGLIALLHLREVGKEYRGAALSAPWLRAAQPSWLRAFGRVMGKVFPGMALPNGLGPQRLTSDPEMAEAWRNDSLIHSRITGRLFRGAEEAQADLLREARVWGGPPVLFLIPGADRVVDSRVTEEFARGFTEEEVQVEILEGRLHESFNDVGRDEVLDLLASWMTELGR